MQRNGRSWVRYDNKKTPFIEEEIENILNTKYHGVLPHTREYIREGLRRDGGKFKARYNAMVSEDFAEQLLKANPKFSILDLDLSKVPKVLEKADERISIICNNTIAGVVVGEVVDLQKNWLSDNNALSKLYPFILDDGLNEREERYNALLQMLKLDNPDLDFSEAKILSHKIPFKVTCKKCNSSFWVTINQVYSLQETNKSEYKIFCSNCQRSDGGLIEKRKNAWVARMEKLHGDKCDYSKCVYISSHVPIEGLICKVCGKTFSQYAISHEKGLGCCPSCAKIEVGKKFRSNIENVKKVTEERYGPGVFDWSKAVYETNQTPIILTDIASGIEFSITPNHLMFGTGTPINHARSLGERLVHQWLGEHKDTIEFLSEQTHKEVKRSNNMPESKVRIDFEIFSVSGVKKPVWIECNGLQHYEYNRNYIMFKTFSEEKGKEVFKRGLERDENVKKYCKDNGILFLEIPYTCYRYDCIYDILQRVLINGEDPSFIEIPQIKYIED